ncbi:PREDICTED: uncharacterized protein LOC18592841 [Theobroma cacao]|uniref:Uncharacterized protein LOC18592841 n=1 Tax=Theobroma cacao TaxID=3641 RepID=A0AB32UW23_THECC|nr:PREDICTED: uncharacterized protein LOC18592841 [Theobroma cacao]
MEKEKEKEKEGERIETINHFSHPHPLLFNDEEQSDKSKEARCSACLESLLGSSFSCAECDFHLHKKCAEAPSEIHSPFHCKHAALTLFPNPTWGSPYYICDLCKENRKMFAYYCTSCYASLDIKCAFLLHNMDENFRELKYVTHEHPLTFIENPTDELKRAHCCWCQKPLVDSLYVCLDCRFYLHKKCAQLPAQLHHPCHRKHPLYLEDARLDCKTCQKKHWSLFYRCLPCEFAIDIECVLSRLRPVIEHDHSFTQFLTDEFICDACGTEGNYVSYICSTCHIMIHKNCISLPLIIKTTWHHHEIIHNYFFQKWELEKHDCGICLGEVQMQYGSYDCLKQDCNFVAHVDCAMEKYLATGQINDQDEESSENLASITCVVETNQHGEAIKIKHFSHEHVLTLDNEIKEDDDKRCDACMLSISISFYYCSQCEFLLHKTCVELPRKKHYWFHESLFTLHLENIFECGLCYHYCSGFAYHGGNNYKFCLRCVGISRILPRQRHKHTLFFDFDLNEGQCNACGDHISYQGAYKCKDCTFALNFDCLTLPQRARHKCDKHFLELTFHDEKNDLEEYYCDICEEKRDPNHWFYHCAICDNSAHPKCVFGKYLFLNKKIGKTYTHWYHSHPLICVKKSYDICDWCYLPYQDIVLECKACTPNYTIHFDCLWSLIG